MADLFLAALFAVGIVAAAQPASAWWCRALCAVIGHSWLQKEGLTLVVPYCSRCRRWEGR